MRQVYLSTTSSRLNPFRVGTSSFASLLAHNNQSALLTDTERGAIDAETKGVIQEPLTVISRLETTTKVRVQTEEALLLKRYTSGLRGIFVTRRRSEKRRKINLGD
ncbi:hypothetical protein L873DRAFT_1869614 [Choiromyces venosus 120613-1]|uniref:Uncharacterized protein n=1 Tax=Choiromyces venosus 120613-1 TaxID=1336337 RepID=A0A3N4IZW3_9PEZI|nr:hypothetical protein L873DRAFT_1869614 [Choiromyces venosus 120613-1]